MADKRLTAVQGPDLVRFFAHEDGVHYRGHTQNLDPALDRVKRLNEINERPTKNGWRYGGSIPVVMLTEWLNKTKHRMDEFARSRELRQEFIRWMQDRDRRGFIADDGQYKIRRRGTINADQQLRGTESGSTIISKP